jgi:hypothetical protein
MKGKILNVRGENIKKISENKEITEIKKILGLESNKKYETMEDVNKLLRYGKVVFMTDYDDESFTRYINKLKEDQIERMSKKERPLNIFIGFDDVIFAEAISSRGKPTMAERVILISRHELNATVFICVQHSKQVNSAMRNNTIYNVILPLQKNDLLKVAEEHAGHLSTDEFVSMYYNIMAKGPHEFIVVDYKAPEERRFRHNWDKIITHGKDASTTKPSPKKALGPSVRRLSSSTDEEPPSKKPDSSEADDATARKRGSGNVKGVKLRQGEADEGTDRKTKTGS